jgi:hypothetical protein
MVFSSGSWNWTISLVSTALVFVLWTKRTFSRIGAQSSKTVCHRTDGPNVGGGTAILVPWGTSNYAEPVSRLRHLEATGSHETTTSGTHIPTLAVSDIAAVSDSSLLLCLAMFFSRLGSPAVSVEITSRRLFFQNILNLLEFIGME